MAFTRPSKQLNLPRLQEFPESQKKSHMFEQMVGMQAYKWN